jgi:glycosyltransferase involved in cell wall biosynthesis
MDPDIVSTLAVVIAAAPLVTAIYAYIGYPAIVWVVARLRPHKARYAQLAYPTVTITVPVYNSVSTIRNTLERLLEVDYPHEKTQLVVLSDASTDGTDDVVREFAARGVELLRAPVRRGKTVAENSAVAVARGDIIVNVDSTVVVPRSSLKELVRAFEDPTVGVASGRDVSVGGAGTQDSGGESGYTSYEMRLRALETLTGSIVGASGCFYGIRRSIRVAPLPDGLSWDFASTLVARQQGYRSVSVGAAVCFVPRTPAIRSELKRKTRTMARGLRTLFHFRELLNPVRYGGFALMLISHKLFRWLPYLFLPLSILALGILAAQNSVAAILFAALVVGGVSGVAAISRENSVTARPLLFAGFAVSAVSAGFLAWVDALRGAHMATWDPTPRPSVTPS